eukprot:2335782-Pleurochrysis_carterae.AAC.2
MSFREGNLATREELIASARAPWLTRCQQSPLSLRPCRPRTRAKPTSRYKSRACWCCAASSDTYL